MELNPKLIQYSLDIKYIQSKLIQSQHNQHLKKLDEINKKSFAQKIKKQSKSVKQLSQALNRNKQISKIFKIKQSQQKRCYEDLKMMRSISQIHRNRKRQQKKHTQTQKDITDFKQRKQKHNRLSFIMKSKQLEEQNLKIAMRITRHQNNYSYVQKIRKDIEQYKNIKKNMQRIKDQPLILSRVSKDLKKHKISALLTLNQQKNQGEYKIKNRAKTQIKMKTQNCQEDDEDYIYGLLRQKSSNIINEKVNKDNLKQKDLIYLPDILNSKNQYKK